MAVHEPELNGERPARRHQPPRVPFHGCRSKRQRIEGVALARGLRRGAHGHARGIYQCNAAICQRPHGLQASQVIGRVAAMAASLVPRRPQTVATIPCAQRGSRHPKARCHRRHREVPILLSRRSGLYPPAL